MPLDPNIALSFRMPALTSPLELAGQFAQLRAAENANALAGYNLSKARREDEAENALADAYRASVGAGGQIDRTTFLNKLAMGAGAGRIPTAMKNFREEDKQKVELDKTKAETRDKNLAIIGGALVSSMQDPSDENLVRNFTALDGIGIDTASLRQQFAGMNPDQRRQTIKGFASGTAVGREAMQALTSKVEYKDAGGALVPVETNALAGVIGPTAGPQIARTLTPGERLVDARTRAEGAANRAVTIRGQDLAAAERGIPSGYRRTASGELTFIPGGPADPAVKEAGKPLTEFQGKSTAFGLRAQAAHDILNELATAGNAMPSVLKQSVQGIPLVGGALGMGANVMASGPQQQVEQAQRDFINAVLRQESGAVISDSEFINARQQYFPQPGDSPKVIEQKRANRERAIEGFKVSAGPGAGQIKSEPRGAATTAGVDSFDEMPDPRLYNGRTIDDSKTGIAYRSNGSSWVKVK